ncbi:PREDICTED: uncharacterized protein LOC103324284 [Prunus mume]|uniref:Uncharacterized protein LOC103324284 n=1 Tax=Prunus mume TaxID=102107 RepID=A0ABM0NGP6_PRUMU|nr:PREDICTED: uncharacterized protein LOC103324284 [Prunus mume]
MPDMKGVEEPLDIYREEEALDIHREDDVEEVDITPEDAALYKLAHKLFDNAMNGQWEEVVGVYRSSENVHDMRITKMGDTALHIAASDGETEIVLHLLRIIGNDASRILQIKNKKGNTPLHLAAVVGDVETCHAMATKDRKLVSSLNNENETPLFLAALNGHEKVFLCLHSHCDEERCYSFRARNGDTILHAAMSGEYFSLAFQIILWHPQLVKYINHSGLSPLHVLANTPSAFKSSSRLRLFDRLIYQCLIAEELKGQKVDKKICPRGNKGRNIDNRDSESQELTKSWGNRICSSLSLAKRGNKKEDAENPQQKNSSMQGTNQREEQVEMYRFLRGLLGISSIQKIHQDKRKHKWATQVMNKLLDHTSSYMYAQSPKETRPTDESKITQVPEPPELEKPELDKKMKRQLMTPILIAAKMGVSEMVEKILKKFPVAIHDVDSENKNVALLAVENRQPHVYSLLVDRKKQITSLLRQVDNNGNNALHLAAKSGSHRPWNSPGSALQLQWELKWYMFVKNRMPPHSSVRYNKDGETPQQIFATSHKDLHKEGSNWLAKTSESCSVVAALIATVSFATSATVPGGLNDKTGSPVLEDKPAFNAFTISSLLSLCLSLTALALFYSIITSRFKVQEFSNSLPRKLLLGLTSLFASIASALVSFCTGHMFLLNRQLKHLAYPLYATTCIPITIFALSLLPLYSDLLQGIFTKVPQHNQME